MFYKGKRTRTSDVDEMGWGEISPKLFFAKIRIERKTAQCFTKVKILLPCEQALIGATARARDEPAPLIAFAARAAALMRASSQAKILFFP